MATRSLRRGRLGSLATVDLESRWLKAGETFDVELKATVYPRPKTWREALARLR